MASFASVNHPPFAYDPSCKPTKSILKQKSRLSRSSSSWLSTINSRLSTASMNFGAVTADSPNNSSSSSNNNNNSIPPSLVTNSNNSNNDNNDPQQQVQAQEPAPARSLFNFKKFMNANNNNSDNNSISSFNSLQDSHSLDTDELAPDELKRVRFSVKQLTTEYYPYRAPTPPPPAAAATAKESEDGDDKQEEVKGDDDDDDDEPSTAGSVDAPELTENAAALLLSDSSKPKDDDDDGSGGDGDAKLQKAALCDNKKKTPTELYEIACRNKEEMPLPAFIINLSRSAFLTKIDLSNQAMNRRVVEPIADVLGSGFDLQELILKNCGLEDDALKVLLYTLLLNDTLRHLNLADNKKLKTTGFKYIAIYVKGSHHLEHLDLSRTNPDKKAIQYLAQALTASPTAETSSSPSLKRLLLDGCLLKPQSLEVLASGVRKSPNLRHISLQSNRINNQGAIWLGVMLRDYDSPENIKGLEYMNLNNNDIRQGVQYIAQALRRNRSLTELHLHDCKLDPKACAFIGEALKYNQALAKLDISANSLVQPSAEGILAIKQALYVNWKLKELNMSGSGLGSEAAIYLAECLPENRSLLRLDLSKNLGIDLAGMLALSASVRINDTLTFLDVNIPPNDREMARTQGDIVARCTKNAQNVSSSNEQQQRGQEQDQRKEVQRTGSQSSLDPNAMVTTAQSTARLTLQERLAAVTRGKSSPAVNSNNTIKPTLAENAKATTPPPQQQQQQQQQKKKSIVVDAEMVTTATTQVSLFEDMLKAEASQRDEVMDAVQPPGDVIRQVYGQCRKSQTVISAHIPKVTDDDELAQLLVLNDRLTTAINRYQQLFSAETTTATTTPNPAGEEELQHQQQEQHQEQHQQQPESAMETTKNESKLEEGSSVTTSSSFLLEGTEPPLSTSFEIGDVDEDDDDDMVPMRHPSPGIESQ
ncbi:hypothetical protein BDB00DRAFT_877172 [Zychaea mexicana]|uniref:uncharacterized protein n=1 Tax=Zychaea mexicana TaxID=64656 RepID=UPI0022FE0F74|nr:uncharacterized protein BDB00DRAFT_877172 [Zychaea mexicana]KAI9488702.1 hypothetical protein BDB00DRAFT_877172 [Zychaea mexicana]